ncbi:MAG: urease accessory protein UreF [Chloroflexi bacterium]|nr:urease accessory protein UreF [Chloroflexota bacterium]
MQITDRSFPTGAYVHSAGLESIVGQALLSVEDAVRLRLRQIARLDLVFLMAAYERPPCDLDRRFHAMIVPREARDASAQVGRQLLRNAADLFDTTALREFAEHAPHAHHAVVSGVIGDALGIQAGTAATLYGYQAVRDQVSAAQRLTRLGQTEAQRMIHRLKPDVLAAVATATQLDVEDAATFAPILDIAAMAHERAAVRLFVS